MKWLRSVEEQIETLQDAGFQAKFLILSLNYYQELMAHLAAADGLDHMDARIVYRECVLIAVNTPDMLEVVPDVRDIWERGNDFIAVKSQA